MTLLTSTTPKTGKPLAIRRPRRDNQRMTAPRLTVKIQGHYYQTLDWSYGGLRLSLPPTSVVPQPPLMGIIIGSDDDIGVFSGTITRVDPANRSVSIHFTEVSDDTFDLLDRLVREKLVGAVV